jgi:hypothetical protein
MKAQITFFHDGPLFAYLSKSPEQTRTGLQSWDGDGDYFKIADRGPDDDESWWGSIGYSPILFSEVLKRHLP